MLTLWICIHIHLYFHLDASSGRSYNPEFESLEKVPSRQVYKKLGLSFPEQGGPRPVNIDRIRQAWKTLACVKLI
jgi:hypothetical protein